MRSCWVIWRAHTFCTIGSVVFEYGAHCSFSLLCDVLLKCSHMMLLTWSRTGPSHKQSITVIKWGWKAYATSTSRLFRRAFSRSFDQFCLLCFCSGLSLEDFNMVTELSHYNLGVAFFDTLIARSYLINFLINGGFLWLAPTICYSKVNLTSDRLCLSDLM